jgi:hypothetical protein
MLVGIMNMQDRAEEQLARIDQLVESLQKEHALRAIAADLSKPPKNPRHALLEIAHPATGRRRLLDLHALDPRGRRRAT